MQYDSETNLSRTTQAYADENQLLFMETSAKTATNVNDIFLAIAKKLPKNDAANQQGQRLNVAQTAESNQSGGCCK